MHRETWSLQPCQKLIQFSWIVQLFLNFFEFRIPLIFKFYILFHCIGVILQIYVSFLVSQLLNWCSRSFSRNLPLRSKIYIQKEKLIENLNTKRLMHTKLILQIQSAVTNTLTKAKEVLIKFHLLGQRWLYI